MEMKLVRIAEISATSKHPIFTSVYHLINEDMLKQCHKELDGNKAVGIDKVTKDEYGKKGAYHLPTAPFIISPILFFSNSLTVKIFRSTINFYLSDIVYPL